MLCACSPASPTAAADPASAGALAASTARTAELQSGPPGVACLNGRLVLRLDGPVDPLGVTDRSVEVRRDDGRPLAAHLDTAAGDLTLELVVSPELLADPPAAALVRLQGLPSPHALVTTDGRRLRSSATIRWPLDGRLQGTATSPPRLLAIDDQALPPPGSAVLAHGPLHLRFDGVIDPATIAPETCPLFPEEHALVLKTPLLPSVDWRCTGERFELILDVGPALGTFQLNLASFGLRDFSGRSPEPRVQIEIRAS